VFGEGREEREEVVGSLGGREFSVPRGRLVSVLLKAVRRGARSTYPTYLPTV
jgi:hypothetical protein